MAASHRGTSVLWVYIDQRALVREQHSDLTLNRACWLAVMNDIGFKRHEAWMGLTEDVQSKHDDAKQVIFRRFVVVHETQNEMDAFDVFFGGTTQMKRWQLIVLPTENHAFPVSLCFTCKQ